MAFFVLKIKQKFLLCLLINRSFNVLIKTCTFKCFVEQPKKTSVKWHRASDLDKCVGS